jgi:hypothetical protein
MRMREKKENHVRCIRINKVGLMTNLFLLEQVRGMQTL